MQLTIHYEPATPRAVVVLHAWHPAASPWHLESAPEVDGTFRFTLEHTVADQREIQFKYFFPREGNRWESDDYIRRVPTRDAAELWTFDFSARCLTRDPYAAPAPDHVIFHAITRRFQGGTLFAWTAAGGQSERFAETSRDSANQLSTFDVPLPPWMRRGFLFKLVTADEQFEAEPYNRLWRPADGGEAWFKSGQVDVRSTPLTSRAVTIELIHGRTLVPIPTLNVADSVDDFRDEVAAATTEDLDAAFCVSSYRATIYPEALYWIRAGTAGAGWNLLERPFRWREDLPAMPSIAVAGSDRWLAARPARTALVRLFVHSNPGSAWPQAVDWNLAVGGAPPHETITAARQADGTWVADFPVFPELTHGLTPSSAGVAEGRPDGPFDPRREFEAPAGGPTTLHTTDGIAGMARIGGPAFADVPANTRHALLAEAYSRAVADAGVFDAWEMPHGPVVLGDDAWFTLRAPHAVQAQLIVLDPASPAAGARRVAAYPMRLTPDLRYWWCRVPRAAVPHGAFYRFLLNDDLEVLDPAARWAHDPGRLWCQPGEGRDGPWARFVDPARIRAIITGSQWRTMGWQALVVYELHPRRFTRRNANVSSDFDQVVRELQPGGYLQRLPVRALEFLPVHEFPSAQSWGYNPSLFFAVDSSYGGPEELARCVRACHDAGRAVLLDIVFNHMTESPLQTIARDTYVSGETNWGDMVHYAHPACREFFRQALVHLWQTYALDGFRFDATEAIVNGHVPNGYILRKTGNGKGWEFLGMLRQRYGGQRMLPASRGHISSLRMIPTTGASPMSGPSIPACSTANGISRIITGLARLPRTVKTRPTPSARKWIGHTATSARFMKRSVTPRATTAPAARKIGSSALPAARPGASAGAWPRPSAQPCSWPRACRCSSWVRKPVRTFRFTSAWTI